MSEMWEAAASGWRQNAEFVDHHLAGPTARLLDAAAIEAGSVVLEIACGPGGAGIAAAERGATVTFSDVSQAMVATAAERAPGAQTVVSDQSALDLRDGTFDAVVSRHGLMFADPAADAVREAARVLVPGGRYAAMVWDRRDANPWLGAILDAVGEQFGVPFPPPGVAGPFSLDDPDVLAAAFRDGGLDDVTVETVAAPMAVSLDEWWDRVPRLAGPLAQALAGLEPEVRDSIRDRALAKGAPIRAADGFPGSVLIAAGRKR